MSKATTQQPPIEIHKAELLPERDLETVINSTLVKHNITDAVIAGLKDKYKDVKLKDINDKESYLECVSASKEIRKVEIIIEKVCKVGREDAVREQKLWLAEEKKRLNSTGEFKNPIDADIKKFDDNLAEQEAAEKRKQEEQFMSRQTTLLKMEAVYSGNSFTLGNVSYEINNIKEADEEIWNDVILAKYKKEFEKVEAVRADEEKKKQEAADELARQQELFAEQKLAFERQQKELADQQKLLDEQKKKQDDEIRETQQRKDNEVREAKATQDRNRIQQLQSLGLHFTVQGNAYVYEDVNVDVMTELNLFDEAQWNKLIEEITPIIDERKLAALRKEQARIEKEKQDAIDLAIQQEKDRVAEEKRLDEVKRQQEEQLRLEELAKASDKDKWASFLSLHNAITLPEFKSAIYKSKLQQYKEKMEEVNAL